MADSKKRTLEDEQEMGVSKKRALSSAADSPVPVNGKSETGREEINAANVESFRKDAIYRRMKHYSRENDRAHEQIAVLEKRRDILEANLLAISACWEQLVQEVGLLVKPEARLAQNLPDQSNTLFDIVSDPELGGESTEVLVESLRECSRSTRDLVAAFTAQIPALSPENESLRRQCSTLQKQVVALRAKTSLSNQRISDLENDKYLCYSKLQTVEARIERIQRASSHNVTPLPPDAVEERKVFVNEEHIKQENGIGSIPLAVTPHAGQAVMNGITNINTTSPDEDWKCLYEASEKRNNDLIEEMVQLKTQCSSLTSELACPNQESLQKSPIFARLREHLQSVNTDMELYRDKCSELTPQVDQMRELQEDFKEKLTADYSVRYDEQKSLIIKRDLENVRLREQRNAFQMEGNELKARTSEKKSISQLEILLQSRADRIAALELESKRLKSHLAANAGQEDVLELILSDKLANLPELLRIAERKSQALQSSLETLESDHPEVAKHIRSEAEAREALAVALSRLQRFESTFGPGSTLSLDQESLIKQLREKDELLRAATLRHCQEQAASNDLFAEIERLSAAWEALDRQNKAKVFDMENMESKLQKLAAEKAKADNRYYSAMRQKDAADALYKAKCHAIEKLQNAVEKFTETEKVLTSKLSNQEKEITVQKNRYETLVRDLTTAERQRMESDWRRKEDQDSLAEMKRQLVEAHTQEKQYRLEAKRFEDESIKARKEVERLAIKANVVSSGSTTAREIDLEQKYEKCMKLLRCSTCKQNLRSHVLTKCMHTFCKDCVQARIDTRQRKCPACQMAFSQSEFQQLYFQG
ncbi:hypothetical protein BU17DRAFT_89013 [Hysterangium stoloniferum]|nr:hypothetical protein BU17DRAFT_89013 [Hysterangium stoloniferum]